MDAVLTKDRARHRASGMNLHVVDICYQSYIQSLRYVKLRSCDFWVTMAGYLRGGNRIPSYYGYVHTRWLFNEMVPKYKYPVAPVRNSTEHSI